MTKILTAIFALVVFTSAVPAVSYAKSEKRKINTASIAAFHGKTPPGQVKKSSDDERHGFFGSIHRWTRYSDDYDSDENITESCPSKAFGHLIAPGWIKNKHEGEHPKISEDCNLPHGIWKKFHGDDDEDDNDHPIPQPTSTDVIAPTISNVATGSGTSTITISWNTNEPSDSQIIYGTSTSYGLLSPLNSQLITSHLVALSNLTASTTYHFSIRSRDASNNLATSTDYAVTTLPLPDTTAPIISLVAASTTASSALVSWNTDELSSSKVFYATSSHVDTLATSTLFEASSTLVTSHMISLMGLNANTTYYLVIESRDASNNLGNATSSFITAL